MSRPRPSALPHDISELLTSGFGVVTVADAAKYTIEKSRLRQLCRSGVLTRTGLGAYVSTTELENADSWAALQLRAKGFVMSRSPGAFLVGEAAAALLDLRTVDTAPSRPVIAVSRNTTTRPTRYGVVRPMTVPGDHTRMIHGRFATMSPAWVATDLARRLPLASALILVDGVARLHTLELARSRPRPEMVDGTSLVGALASMARWPGSRRAEAIVELADPGAERAIESLGRLAFLDAGLPPSVSNAWVRAANGAWRRVDHLFPWHGVVAEADGAVKYDSRPDASRIVADEKEREWELREMGLVVGRYTWAQARRAPSTVATRIGRLLIDNPPRERPVPYWLGVTSTQRREATPDMWPSPMPTSSVLPAGPRW